MSRSCLLLVDVLDDFHHEGGEALLRSFRERSAALTALVSCARAEDVPIVYANDNRGVWDGEASRLIGEALGGPAGDLVVGFAPRGRDRFVVKPRYLDQVLGIELLGLEQAFASFARHRSREPSPQTQRKDRSWTQQSATR